MFPPCFETLDRVPLLHVLDLAAVQNTQEPRDFLPLDLVDMLSQVWRIANGDEYVPVMIELGDMYPTKQDGICGVNEGSASFVEVQRYLLG